MVISIRKVAKLATLLPLFSICASVFADESKQWLFEIRYSIAGISQTIPTQQHNQCLSPAAPVPDISRPGYECRSSNQSWFGKTLVWQVDCSNEWERIQGTGRVNFDKEKAAGDIHLQIINPSSPPEYMVLSVQGKPLGACTK